MVRFYYIDENMSNVHVYAYTYSYIKSRHSKLSKINLSMDDDLFLRTNSIRSIVMTNLVCKYFHDDENITLKFLMECFL